MSKLNVVLYQPEIAGNTGNIIRLCANTGASLHLIRPLGFTLDDARMRRAGLDYAEFASMQTHEDLTACLNSLDNPRVFAFTARATKPFHLPTFTEGDVMLFGPESAGLPQNILGAIPDDQHLQIPMQPHSRSLNLSNAVAVAVYEGLRQLGYPQS